MIFMLDDYHNIHAKKVPQKLRPSTAVHMASSLLDIHMSVPVVSKTSQAPLHRPVPVFIEGQVKVCKGGIASEVVKSIMADALRSMQTMYLHQIHPKLAQIDPAKLIQSMQEMRYIQLVF